MSGNNLKKFLIGSEGAKQVSTVPYDCEAKILNNEKVLNYINYFKSAASLSGMPNFQDQIKSNVGNKGIKSSLINVKFNNGVHLNWNFDNSCYDLRFNNREDILQIFNVFMLKPLGHSRKYPWLKPYMYSNGSDFSLIPKDGYSQYPIFDESTIKNEHLNITLTTEVLTPLQIFNALVELTNTRDFFVKLMNKAPAGLNNVGIAVRQEKLSTYIDYIDSILVKEKYLTLGRYSTEKKPITPKSFPFVLYCKLDLSKIIDNLLIVTPLDAIRLPNTNIFADSQSSLSDSFVSRYSTTQEMTIDHSVYDLLNRVGQGCKEDIFQKDVLTNYILWDKIIYSYIEKFHFSDKYTETDNLIFFDPNLNSNLLVNGYELAFNTVVEADSRGKVIDNSVLYYLLNSPMKYFDKSFNFEINETMSPEKAGTSHKGIIKSILGKVPELDLFQKNFLYKSLNYLSVSKSKFSSPLITLNAPPHTDKVNTLSTYLASQVVESTYASFNPEITFLLSNPKDSLLEHFKWSYSHRNVSKADKYSFADRWIVYSVNNVDTPLDYCLDLNLVGSFSFESLAIHFLKSTDQLTESYLDHALDASKQSFFSPDSISTITFLTDIGILKNIPKNFYNDYKFEYSQDLEAVIKNIHKLFKKNYEFFIRCETFKREFLHKFNTLVVESTNRVNSAHSQEDLLLLNNEPLFLRTKVDIEKLISQSDSKIGAKRILSEDLKDSIYNLKQQKIASEKKIKCAVSSVKDIVEKLIQDLKSIDSTSSVLLKIKGGKKSLKNKINDKYKNNEYYSYFKHIINQYVLTPDDSKFQYDKILALLPEINYNIKNESTLSDELARLELEISELQQELLELNKEIETLEADKKNIGVELSSIQSKLNLIDRLKKYDADFIKQQKSKSDLLDIIAKLNNKIIVPKQYISILNSFAELVEDKKNIPRLITLVDTILSSAIDSVFKPLLFNLSMRWNEGVFITELFSLVKGSHLEAVIDRFKVFSRIFPVFVTDSNNIAHNIKTTSTKGYCSISGLIDTLVFDSANSISIDQGALGLALAKKCIVLGDTYSPGPRYKITENMDISLSTKVLDSGYFITPEIQENVFNCHNASILSVAQFYNPWQPFPELRRGDYLLSTVDIPLELLMFTDVNFYKYNLYYPKAPIYFNGNKPVYLNLLDPIYTDRASLNYIDNGKILKNELLLPDQKPFKIIPNNGSFNSFERVNNKEIISILKFIDDNFDYLIKEGTLANSIAIISPFRSQANKLKEAALKINFNNSKLNILKNDLFNPSSPNSIFIGDVSHISNLKVPIVLYSNVYDAESGSGNNCFDRDPTVLNVAITSATQSFYIFASSDFIEQSDNNNNIYLAALFKLAKQFID